MNPYETLGVSKNAGKDEIRKAYRRKARKAHPDRADGSTETMTALNRAYALLSDDTARERFDATGDTSARPSVDQIAQNMLVEVFNAATEQLDEYVDVIEAIRRKLDQERLKQREQIKGANACAARVEKQLKRLKWKAARTERNFLAGVLENRVRKAKAAAVNAEQSIKAMERALELLADFSWEADKKPAPMSTWSTGGGGFFVFNDGS